MSMSVQTKDDQTEAWNSSQIIRPTYHFNRSSHDKPFNYEILLLGLHVMENSAPLVGHFRKIIFLDTSSQISTVLT